MDDTQYPLPATRRALKIGLIGDTHGGVNHVRLGLDLAQRGNCDYIVQLGDFGIWPGWMGEEFQEQVKEALEHRDVQLYVVPGNHECYDIIDTLPTIEDGWLEWIPGRCFLAPRGHLWEWGGTRFGAMGGAVSIDQKSRVEGVSWWPQESITYGQVSSMLNERREIDVLLVHDTVDGAHTNVTDSDEWNSWIPKDLLANSKGNRTLLREVAEGLQPTLVVGGHWHRFMDDLITLESGKKTRVINLAHDGTPGFFMTLDIDDSGKLHTVVPSL